MDYIIVGAGPCGLAIAYLLGRAGKKCTLIDQNDSIGGCHRVKRQNGMFTEHSPRVYLSSYSNFIQLLKEMGSHFDWLYTPYDFSIIYIAYQLLLKLTIRETFLIMGEFFFFLLFPNYGSHISMQTFTANRHFSDASVDYLDRLCRFTDGGGLDRYSVYQFIQLINQQGLYRIYQPKRPNDVGLFPIFQTAIQNTNNVTLQLSTKVTSVLYDTQIRGVQTDHGAFYGTNVILAIPPSLFSTILTASPSPLPTAFGELSSWVPLATYNNDIAVTFHWDTVLSLPKVWGFPYSEWGVISVPLTNYMDMNDQRSKTVISTCITYTDRLSLVLQKTADQVTDRTELMNEIFRQLKESYPSLPPPTTSILSPTVYYENGWKETDSAFFKASAISFLPSNGTVPHLYQVGTQNGNSQSAFTTMEAAITNGMVFANSQLPSIKRHGIVKPIQIKNIVWLVAFLLVLMYVKKYFHY